MDPQQAGRKLSGNFMPACDAMSRDCVGLGVGRLFWSTVLRLRFWRVGVGRDASGLVVLGLRCRHQLHAETAGFALQAGEVTLLSALLKFHGAAVDPNLPLGNQPIV
jgi:hypothetical protein